MRCWRLTECVENDGRRFSSAISGLTISPPGEPTVRDPDPPPGVAVGGGVAVGTLVDDDDASSAKGMLTFR